uniref:Integrase catalytic domain-containing protein n=1 Tax=Alloyangia mangrovi TaxID=1779329 RepID=A0A2A3JWA1_9RHOB
MRHWFEHHWRRLVLHRGRSRNLAGGQADGTCARGPNHPQTQGKIERWHQTPKNRILLENHYLPGALEAAIETFVDHYNHQRAHESLGSVTPADVYFDRAKAILAERRRIKADTIRQRRLLNRTQAA